MNGPTVQGGVSATKNLKLKNWINCSLKQATYVIGLNMHYVPEGQLVSAMYIITRSSPIQTQVETETDSSAGVKVRSENKASRRESDAMQIGSVSSGELLEIRGGEGESVVGRGYVSQVLSV